jgi:hypothetical protein
MNPTELKMQPTIHMQSKPGYGRRQNPGLLCKCIVCCIFNSVGLIITRNTLYSTIYKTVKDRKSKLRIKKEMNL